MNQTMIGPCGCAITIKIESHDGNFIKGREGDKVTADVVLCKVHKAGPRLLEALREEEIGWRSMLDETKELLEELS
jgi:hypothetical protein